MTASTRYASTCQPAEHAEQQRRAVPDGEQRDVERDVFEAVQEKDHAGEEQQMIVARHHVLGAEVDVRPDVRARRAQQERLIVAGDAVRVRDAADEQDRSPVRALPRPCPSSHVDTLRVVRSCGHPLTLVRSRDAAAARMLAPASPTVIEQRCGRAFVEVRVSMRASSTNKQLIQDLLMQLDAGTVHRRRRHRRGRARQRHDDAVRRAGRADLSAVRCAARHRRRGHRAASRASGRIHGDGLREIDGPHRSLHGRSRARRLECRGGAVHGDG